MRPDGGDYEMKMACMAKCYFDNKVKAKDKKELSKPEVENLLLGYLEKVSREEFALETKAELRPNQRKFFLSDRYKQKSDVLNSPLSVWS